MGPTSTNLRASSALIVQMLLVQVLFQAEECASQNPYTGFARHPLDDEDVGGIGVSRLGGVEVGHRRFTEVSFQEGSNAGMRRKLEVKTISMEPEIFEIPHFLTASECQQLRDSASQSGLEDSVFEAGPLRDSGIEEDPSKEEREERFDDLDANKDGKISLWEIQDAFREANDVAMPEEAVRHMLTVMDIDQDDDDYVSREEFDSVKDNRINDYVIHYRNEVPSSRHRYRNEATIKDFWAEELVKTIRRRIAKVTSVPEMYVRKSEFMQVARYENGGHHHCHVDSDEPTKRADDGMALDCCHLYTPEDEPCRKCRYATLMVYLWDVSDGGQTAFPAAGVAGINDDAALLDEYLNMTTRCNLTKGCSGLTVRPELGKALFWYNHQLPKESSKKTEYAGLLDYRTLHGGCPVGRSIKWIANFWINYEYYQTELPADYDMEENEDDGERELPSTTKLMFEEVIAERASGSARSVGCGVGSQEADERQEEQENGRNEIRDEL